MCNISHEGCSLDCVTCHMLHVFCEIQFCVLETKRSVMCGMCEIMSKALQYSNAKHDNCNKKENVHKITSQESDDVETTDSCFRESNMVTHVQLFKMNHVQASNRHHMNHQDSSVDMVSVVPSGVQMERELEDASARLLVCHTYDNVSS